MPLIAVEVVLGFVPLGWGVWELVSLSRERRRDAEKAARGAAANGAVGSPPSLRSAGDDAGVGPSA
jgi:hypothetical protein